MAKEMTQESIIHHLETDLGEILSLFKPGVFEIMLNPFLREDGTYEGHIWCEQIGKGMFRAFKESVHNLDTYPVPEVNKLILYKYSEKEDGTIETLNYHVIANNSKPTQLFNSIAFVLNNSLKKDKEGNYYLEQEEHYKLDILANNIQEQRLSLYSESLELPVVEGDNIVILKSWESLLAKINRALKRLIGLDLQLGLKFINSENNLKQFRHFTTPKYLISKSYLKMTSSKAEQIMNILASANSLYHHDKNPRLECSIPKYHHRFTGQIAPIVTFPTFTIRQHGSQVKDLSDYVSEGIMPQHVADTIRKWIKDGKNLLIAGGTGSGKTTLLNTLIRETAKIHYNIRVGIIEDTPEIKCDIENSFIYRKSNEVTLDDLLITALRMRPDAIMVGELRGREAYTLFKAQLTGHKNCYGTIHANGAYEATYRFEQCVKEHPECAGSEIPREQIALAVDGIISIQKTLTRVQKDGFIDTVITRKVTALREITGYDPEHKKYVDIIYYKDEEAAKFDTSDPHSEKINNMISSYQQV